MKSKSFGAGALGILLFFAGQIFPVQAETVSGPDRETSAIPGPDRETSTLPAPDRDTSTIPGPDQKTSPPRPPRRAGKQEAPAAAGTGRERAAAPVAPAAPNRPPAVPAGSAARPAWNPPDQGLFFGAMAGMRSLKYNTDDTDWENLDIDGKSTAAGGLFFGLDYGPVVTQVEILFSGDKGAIENMPGFDDITAYTLLIPLILKGDFHLGPVVLQPLAGFYFNIALGDLDLDGSMGGKEPYANPPVGLMVGGDIGMRFGKSRIFLDLRYAADLGKTAVGNDPMTAWRRSAFMLNLGYQFFVWRKT